MTRSIPIRRPRYVATQLPEGQGAWKVFMLIEAEDGVGNRWVLFKRRMPLIRR